MPFRALLLVLGITAAVAAADNWPQFRGPAGDGHANAKPPVQWSETENIRWKTPIPGKAWSSPVIWGDHIWMTNATADGKQLSVVAVDRRSGKIVHDVKVFELADPPFCHPYNSYASSTPVIEEGRLYAHFGSNGTACLDTTNGKVLWERRDLHCDHFRGAASSPIVHDGLLFLIFDGVDIQFVVALDKKTGKTVWKKDRGIEYAQAAGDYHKGYATPALFTIDGKAQLICPSAQATIAYDPATGEELWRVNHGGMNAAARPLLGHGTIYLTSGHTKVLLAVKTGGHGTLTDSHIKWKSNKGVPTRPSLLLVDDLLFMVSDDGIATCLDARTGELIWQERLKGAFSGSPLYADGRLYLAGEEGTTYVLEAGRTFKQLAANRLADGCMASPVAIDKCLLLRTKTHLYCIEQR